MWKVGFLGILWVLSIVGLCSASAVIHCIDANQKCTKVRVVAQSPSDVSEVMQKYPRAELVDFHGNLLENLFDRNIPSFAQWKVLNLSYNLLNDDVFERVQQTQLQVVDLTYNQLGRVSIPASVIEFIAERNKLFQVTIKSNDKLQRLILPKNEISSLAPFKNLRKLEELDLSCNKISEINTADIATMTSLKIIKLPRNHIHSISGINSIASLQYLDLSNNILTVFADSKTIFPNVKSLFLQNNKIVMWLPKPEAPAGLNEISLENNDWDCNNLKSLLQTVNPTMIVARRTECETPLNNEQGICCKKAESPYADRLISYRKQEFKALQEGTHRQTGNTTTCDKYEPNPCDGDDNLVYQVAGAAVQNVESLARSNLQELDLQLKKEETLVNKIREDFKRSEQEHDSLSYEHSQLVTYINDMYNQAKLEGSSDLVKKLQDLFQDYENKNNLVKDQITAEERKNQDKLDEINRLETEAEDLNYRKSKLEEEVGNRNATVQGYNLQIERLKKRLNQK